MPRPKGSLNKPKRLLIARLEELFPKYHPVIELATIANDKTATKEERFAANKEVAQYYQPKLKAVDLTGDIDLKTVVKIVDLSGSNGND